MKKLKDVFIGSVSEPGKVVYTLASNGINIIVECFDDESFKIKGPKEVMYKAVGGIGVEDEDGNVILTDADCKNKSIVLSIALEIIQSIKS